MKQRDDSCVSQLFTIIKNGKYQGKRELSETAKKHLLRSVRKHFYQYKEKKGARTSTYSS